MNLTVLNRLVELLGIPLSQLFLEREGGVSTYTYALEQEKMLVGHPRVLALFDLLISGESLPSIRRKYSFTEENLVSMLVKLDRAGLIELHPHNKIKIKQSGEPQWIPGGPLSTKYRKQMIDSLLADHAKAETTFFIHNYVPEDVVLLKGKIKELENLMLTCNARAVFRNRDSKSYGAYLCLKKFEWSLRGEL